MPEQPTVQVVFHNALCDCEKFKLQKGSRPWNTMLLISKGAFRFFANGYAASVRALGGQAEAAQAPRAHRS